VVRNRQNGPKNWGGGGYPSRQEGVAAPAVRIGEGTPAVSRQSAPIGLTVQ
jgi:hypothetical protein